MTDRKKPGWAFWATVVISMPVLYVLSFGPLFWLESKGYLPDEGLIANACRIYAVPVRALYETGPKPIHDALDWYSRLWK